jgi:hypothetical protein
MRWLAILLLTLTAAREGRGTGAIAVRVVREGSRTRYALRVTQAPLPEVADSVARATGCTIEVDPKLEPVALSLDAEPRSAERLYLALARSVPARLSIRYRFRLGGSPGAQLFAHESVEVQVLRPTSLRELAAELPAPVEVDEGISGRVILSGSRCTLGMLLDEIARQSRSSWTTVLSFEPRLGGDAEAAAAERMHEHLSELASLTGSDRREEIADELRRLESLSGDERQLAVRRIARDILSLGTLLKRVPGEHRGPVMGQVLPVARDYLHVVRGRAFPELREALAELEGELRAVR